VREPSEDVLGRRRTGRISDLPPGRTAVPGQLDPVRGADVHRVTARRDAVGCDVLPLGAELPEFPVGPRRAAVDRQPPAVADRAVPNLARGSEPERVHEVPRDLASARVRLARKLLPPPAYRP